jgi:hypothetical protein
MKKVILAFFLILSVVALFGVKASAAGTGNLVVHFHAWDNDYTDLGSHAWGPADFEGKIADGVDDFGAYYEFLDVAINTRIGFIAVTYVDGKLDWSNSSTTKLTGDVFIPEDTIIEGETVHVYIFEGAESVVNDDDDVITDSQVFVASNDHYNMLLTYYDPSGSYEENLGVHAWGDWVSDAEKYGTNFDVWGTPALVFSTAGKTASGDEVKAAMIQSTTADDGLLIYAGDDATKKTGNVNLADALDDTPALGETGVAYVLSKGDAYTAGDNVYYNDPATFALEAFSFTLMAYDAEEKEGTYAVDPMTIIVKTSALVTNPYPLAANDAEKEAAIATVESWFTVREITGTETYGDPLSIERVDFAVNNATINSFVIILAEELDNTKDYEVFFNLNLPEETLAVAKDVAVTLNLTVPENTPVDAVMSIAGSLTDPVWTPGLESYIATQVGDTLEYTLTFNVSVTEPYTTFEYKWTRGTWDSEEFVANNRKLVIPNNVDSISFDDEVLDWKDIDAPAEKYAEPTREAKENLNASIVLDLDREAPVIVFISPSSVVGIDLEDRIIEVAWGQPFNQNLFPRFRATDDRDGDLTPFIFVPKGDYSVLDTRTEGDYEIMLRVVDEWGNVKEETFIFRVVKE